MRYHDNLYGVWEIPDGLKPIIQTTAAARLRDIAQSVFPAQISPTVLPSRFHHSLGVCRLALELVRDRQDCRDFSRILPVAAILHDMANPPFSHLSKPFLKELTGCDGETFLGPFLRHDSELSEAVAKTGFGAEDILGWVCGTNPLSAILNGYPDIDNLDNVCRYYYTANLGKLSLNTFEILRNLVLDNGQWVLLNETCREVRVWERMRQAIYQHVYGYPELAITTMLQRALYFAFMNDELDGSFFKFDEARAMRHLRYNCNKWTMRLVEKLTRWEWQVEIFSLTEYGISSTELGEIMENHLSGNLLADRLSEVLGLSRDHVSIHACRKKERKVLLPVRNHAGNLKTFESAFQAQDECVLCVYVDQSMVSRKEDISLEMEKLL